MLGCLLRIIANSKIQTLLVDNFLNIIDSQSALLTLNSNLFKSKMSQLALKCRSLIFKIRFDHKHVHFLLVPEHVRISGNEKADSLTVNVNKIRSCPSNFLPYSDLTQHFHKIV